MPECALKAMRPPIQKARVRKSARTPRARGLIDQPDDERSWRLLRRTSRWTSIATGVLMVANFPDGCGRLGTRGVEGLQEGYASSNVHCLIARRCVYIRRRHSGARGLVNELDRMMTGGGSVPEEERT